MCLALVGAAGAMADDVFQPLAICHASGLRHFHQGIKLTLVLDDRRGNTMEAVEPTHAFRHAAATELLRQGTALRDIAEFLGHKNMKTVSVYVRTDEASLREAGNFPLDSVR